MKDNFLILKILYLINNRFSKNIKSTIKIKSLKNIKVDQF